MTVDVDVVHDTRVANIDSLLDALDVLNATYRGHGDKSLTPTRDQLAGTGHQLLATEHGPLDLLGAIEHGLAYDDLLEDTIEVEFDPRPLRVLTLEKYVELKEESDFEKDKARLPILRETLREHQKNDDG